MDISNILHLYKFGFKCDAAMAFDKKKKIIIVTHCMLKIIQKASMMTLKKGNMIFFNRT